MNKELGTNGIRNNLEAVMNGLMDGSMETDRAREVSQAAGKYIDSIKVDLLGEALRQKASGFSHKCLELQEHVIDAA